MNFHRNERVQFYYNYNQNRNRNISYARYEIYDGICSLLVYNYLDWEKYWSKHWIVYTFVCLWQYLNKANNITSRCVCCMFTVWFLSSCGIKFTPLVHTSLAGELNYHINIITSCWMLYCCLWFNLYPLQIIVTYLIHWVE